MIRYALHPRNAVYNNNIRISYSSVFPVTARAPRSLVASWRTYRVCGGAASRFSSAAFRVATAVVAAAAAGTSCSLRIIYTRARAPLYYWSRRVGVARRTVRRSARPTSVLRRHGTDPYAVMDGWPFSRERASSRRLGGRRPVGRSVGRPHANQSFRDPRTYTPPEQCVSHVVVGSPPWRVVDPGGINKQNKKTKKKRSSAKL